MSKLLKINNLMSFCTDDDKLLEKYKIVWTKIKDLQDVELNNLLVYDDRYVKIMIRTYGDKVCINFRGLDVPEDEVECECFKIISINSLLVYENKYYFQLY